MSSSQPQVIVLIGPTASGKTELAIEIADHFKTRIHNIDSRQIYKFMDIGTAKPSENQQKKIKHFLIDIEEPINQINVKQFQEIALKSIKKEIKHNNLPFLVGGSGLYMNSITKGFFMADIPPQNNLREQLEKLGQKECWELLKNCDPISAKKINFADQIRTIRALEVFRGKKIDIKCDCCENNDLIPNDFESIKKEKCFGKKSAYMIEKVVDEIVLAKVRRESDGTYSA